MSRRSWKAAGKIFCIGLSSTLMSLGVKAAAESDGKGDFYPNVFTINVPHFADISDLSFLQIGLEFERYLDARGRYSVNGSVYFGTLTGGQSVKSGAASYFSPGVSYHFISNNRGDVSAGIQAGLGSARKYIRPNHNETSSLATLMLQADASLFPGRSFIIGTHLAFGRSFCKAFGDGVIFQVGLKFGARF